MLLTSTHNTYRHCQNVLCADCRENEQPPYQYIATQGPLASTAADFWQMVAEQGTSVVVMLTRCMEADMCESIQTIVSPGHEHDLSGCHADPADTCKQPRQF